MRYEEFMEDIARGFEVVGVAIILIGGVVALVAGLRDFRKANNFFVDVRHGFGRPLILGPEVLVAVPIALSFSLDIEVDGMLPWRQVEIDAKMSAAGFVHAEED